MATAAIAKPSTQSFLHRATALIPGLLLLAAVGYAGKFIEQSINAYAKAHHTPFPDIEFVLWAIVIGLIIANTIGIPRIFAPGVATYEFWLKAGIVLLGSRFLLGDVLHLGGISLLLVAIALTLSLTFMHLLGRAFKLKPKLTSLLAIGSAICGVSAIIAAKPSIDADDEDASYAIAAILALGAISLFTFPLIGHALHLSDKAYGLWTGLAVDNTAEATAAAVALSAKTATRHSPTVLMRLIYLLLFPLDSRQRPRRAACAAPVPAPVLYPSQRPSTLRPWQSDTAPSSPSLQTRYPLPCRPRTLYICFFPQV